MDTFIVYLSNAVAMIYGAYCIFLTATTWLGGNVAACVTYSVLARRNPQGPSLHAALGLMELVYVLVNPLLYFAVLQPAFIPRANLPWLNAAALSALAAFWGMRYFGSEGRSERQRHLARALLLLGGGLALCLFIKDLLADKELGTLGGDRLPPLQIAVSFPLYAFPILMVLRLRPFTASEARWRSAANPFFLAGGQARAALKPLFALATATALVALYRPPESVVHRTLLEHKEKILASSKAFKTDPRLVASIVHLTLTRYSNPFRRTLEYLSVNLWVTDKGSHDGFARALNPSLGLAQIKPVTALTALALFAPARGSLELGKEYRDLPAWDWQGAGWSLVTLQDLPPVYVGAPKDDVVAALEEPSRNIAFCAFILALYSAQWRTANPEWAIDKRPEILATLYQIGFQHSFPKANPEANTFGKEVRDVYDSAWMRENFGETGSAAPR